MKQYKNFITKNKDYFENCLHEAKPHKIMVLGYNYGVKDAFEALMNKEDMYYFPYCLYLIHFGLGVPKDIDFSMKAFETLLVDSKSYLEMPFLAYIAAYCHNRDGDLNLSEDIITCLANDSFAPAVVTRADANWMHKQFKEAQRLYMIGHRLGHYMGRGRYFRWCHQEKMIVSRSIGVISLVLKTLVGRNRGARFVYLDFYGFKAH